MKNLTTFYFGTRINIQYSLNGHMSSLSITATKPNPVLLNKNIDIL